VFDRVEQLLSERGWCRGKAQDRRGRLSVGGAIDVAVTELGGTAAERAALGARARNQLCRSVGAGALEAWNDARTRRRGDVTDLLARARFVAA
jgi:hypothetical protein